MLRAATPRDGKPITQYADRDEAMLGAAKGNEENRAYAVDRIRVLSERFIRELHLKIMGVPAPSVHFCDPAHHTKVGYAVPTFPNIQPHISRLKTFLKKYGMI